MISSSVDRLTELENTVETAGLQILELERRIVRANTTQFWFTPEGTVFQVYETYVEQVPYTVSVKVGTDRTWGTCKKSVCCLPDIYYGCWVTFDVYEDQIRYRAEDRINIYDKIWYPPQELDLVRMQQHVMTETTEALSLINVQRVIIEGARAEVDSILNTQSSELNIEIVALAESLIQKFNAMLVAADSVKVNIQASLSASNALITEIFSQLDVAETSNLEIMTTLSSKLAIFANYAGIIGDNVAQSSAAIVANLNNQLTESNVLLAESMLKLKNSNDTYVRETRASIIQSTASVVSAKVDSTKTIYDRFKNGSSSQETDLTAYSHLSIEDQNKKLVADALPIGITISKSIKTLAYGVRKLL